MFVKNESDRLHIADQYGPFGHEQIYARRGSSGGKNGEIL
jgi:hypothetical protein